ncbi:MFS general substrate transporter [Pseudovirgaria hyperparasitica]|uniref:MFS general substrate transporter n=1 Tax=Pseudovirgaria hyperparasitica TaxID=470096 RepID=A0A6A6W610_9PEZI|nr:MFS general substrate transporter [Pseudovirgaria hyperparasitica]KAF2757464.1 MFS general substrate transporter [Pseudovirgaria hyperparasitica]
MSDLIESEKKGPLPEVHLVETRDTETRGNSQGETSSGPDNKNAYPELLAYSWPTWKKWVHLTVVFFVQISMNYNASVVGNALGLLEKRFEITEFQARLQMFAFLVAYAFGCELWAPWSEDFGRRWILTGSLLLVNIWAAMCGSATNFTTIMVGRVLGGLCSAGGSITLGIVADMFRPDEQGYAVNFVVLASVSGSVVGPVVGGYLEENVEWEWNFWSQVIFGVLVMAAFVALPETRAKEILNSKAKALRTDAAKEGRPCHIKGPRENVDIMSRRQILTGHPETWRHIFTIWLRPFKMFVTEPIVLFLSLLSGFSDALIFTFLNSYGVVFKEPYKLGPVQIGHGFLFLIVGYIIGYVAYIVDFWVKKRRSKRSGEPINPESRLFLLLFIAPFLPVGMFLFAWLSEPSIVSSPWPALSSTVLVGIANYAIYLATVDYMVAAYGAFAASATGGNGFARDLLAGISALYANPLYENVGRPENTRNGSVILACISIGVIIPIYAFYFKGEWIRGHSSMAEDFKKQEAVREEQLTGSRRPTPIGSRRNSSTGEVDIAFGTA